MVLRRAADGNATADHAGGVAAGGILCTVRVRADRVRAEARQRADRARQRANKVRKELQESEQVQEEVIVPPPRNVY